MLHDEQAVHVTPYRNDDNYITRETLPRVLAVQNQLQMSLTGTVLRLASSLKFLNKNHVTF